MRHFKRAFKAINDEFPTARNFLFLLLILDFFFVLLHAYSLTLPLTRNTQLLRLDMDLGYSEIFQYLQYILTAILLLIAGLKTKVGVYIIWAMFFIFLFLDDSFAFHETLGGKLVQLFGIGSFAGLNAQDLGELAIAAVLGCLFVLPFLYTLWRGSEKAKQVTIHLMTITGILVFFGVGMDVIHGLSENLPGSGIFTVLEDSGEMFAASLLVWYALYLFLDRDRKEVIDSEYAPV